jgi:hypothetical protein
MAVVAVDSIEMATTYAGVSYGGAALPELGEVAGTDPYLLLDQGRCLTSVLEPTLGEFSRVDDDCLPAGEARLPDARLPESIDKPMDGPAIYAETLKEFGRIGFEVADLGAMEGEWRSQVEFYMSKKGIKRHMLEHREALARDGCLPLAEIIAWPRMVTNGAQAAGEADVAAALRQSCWLNVSAGPPFTVGPAKRVASAEDITHLAGDAEMKPKKSPVVYAEAKEESGPPLMCWLLGSTLGQTGRILVVLCLNDRAPCFQGAVSACQNVFKINSTVKDVSYVWSTDSKKLGLHSAVRKVLVQSPDWAQVAPNINIVTASVKDVRAIGVGWNRRSVQRAACFALSLTAISRDKNLEAGSMTSFRGAAESAPCFQLGEVPPDEESAVMDTDVTRPAPPPAADRQAEPLPLAKAMPRAARGGAAWTCPTIVDDSSSDNEDDAASKIRAQVIQAADNIASGKRSERDVVAEEDLISTATRRRTSWVYYAKK